MITIIMWHCVSEDFKPTENLMSTSCNIFNKFFYIFKVRMSQIISKLDQHC